jgi:hypothetical protein
LDCLVRPWHPQFFLRILICHKYTYIHIYIYTFICYFIYISLTSSFSSLGTKTMCIDTIRYCFPAIWGSFLFICLFFELGS